VLADGVRHEAGTVIVAKGKHYGGGFISAPKADLHDPSFQVCLFGHSGPWHALRYALALLMGRLHRLKDVKIIEATHIAIEGRADEPIQCDGDAVATLPASVSIAGHTVHLIFPQ
jgi:diacylglycerol kinase family enzyme